MAEEHKYEGAGDPIKLLLKEALEPHCNTVQGFVDDTSLLRDTPTSALAVHFNHLFY